MSNWTVTGGVKIERAKELISEFELASQAFLETHPFSAVSHFDPQKHEVSFLVREGHVIPARLASITADALHNLRSSLDILWHQVWSKGPSGRRKQYFPLFENAHALEGRFKSVGPGRYKTAVDVLRTVRPYKSNRLLWALNEMDNRDKHEKPVLAAASHKRVIIKFPPNVEFQGESGLQIDSEISPPGFLFLETGTELPLVIKVETDHGPVTDMECELTAEIAFARGEILEGQPVLNTLQESVGLVDGIAHAFLSAGLLTS